jgi:hypothetical protein
MTDTLWLWVGFNVFILAMLALDLGVFHRKTNVVSLKESLTWTAVWMVLALGFNAGVWHFAGSARALEFFTGYLIEKSIHHREKVARSALLQGQVNSTFTLASAYGETPHCWIASRLKCTKIFD